jgi:NAD(P)-dependent dehydrogenase (short-subunit alcohol dehydrogenase family)
MNQPGERSESGQESSALKGGTVIVVGGSSGLGRATALATLQQGARVVIASRELRHLEATRQALLDEVPGAAVDTRVIDMRDEAAIAAWFADMPTGSITHLVMSASEAVHGAFTELETREARTLFDSKFWGPYTVAKHAAAKIADGGSITFFSGVLSRRPGVNCSGLGAVNAAIEGLTRALALELGPRLRVNCCSPGMIDTEAYASLAPEARERMYRATGDSLPVGRVGHAEEVAQAVVYLMINGFTTGHVLDVDGGHLVRQYAVH